MWRKTVLRFVQTFSKPPIEVSDVAATKISVPTFGSAKKRREQQQKESARELAAFQNGPSLGTEKSETTTQKKTSAGYSRKEDKEAEESAWLAVHSRYQFKLKPAAYTWSQFLSELGRYELQLQLLSHIHPIFRLRCIDFQFSEKSAKVDDGSPDRNVLLDYRYDESHHRTLAEITGGVHTALNPFVEAMGWDPQSQTPTKEDELNIILPLSFIDDTERKKSMYWWVRKHPNCYGEEGGKEIPHPDCRQPGAYATLVQVACWAETEHSPLSLLTSDPDQVLKCHGVQLREYLETQEKLFDVSGQTLAFLYQSMLARFLKANDVGVQNACLVSPEEQEDNEHEWHKIRADAGMHPSPFPGRDLEGIRQ